MKQQVLELVNKAVIPLFHLIKRDDIILEIPENLTHGDFSTNIAMQLTKELKKNPRQIAEEIITNIPENDVFEKIEIAGPGFINFFLSKRAYISGLHELLEQGENVGKSDELKGKVFIAEHTDPNLFKEVHIGHVMTNTIGESMYRLAKFAGADTKNVTFQGDVGMHIAKAIWGMKNIGEEFPSESTPYEKQQFLGKCYVFGEKHFGEDNKAKAEITAINKKVYSREDSEQNKLYDLGCQSSLDYLETIYEILGSKFDHYFLESTTFEDGQRIVEENTGEKGKKVFEKDGNATVFRGSNFGFHDRVFINSEGLPTYEAKDIGLFYKKWEMYNPDYSLTVTGGDQKEYFQIVREAAGQINPKWKEKTMHIAHGVLKLQTGKMSSRSGKIIRAQEWIEDATQNVLKTFLKREDLDFSDSEKIKISKQIAIAAIKYSILKVSAGKDIVYDEGVALDFTGNTGPYLQYSCVRAMSILRKISNLSEILEKKIMQKNGEISTVEKKLHFFSEIVSLSRKNLSPHFLAHYLYNLSSEFNSFYAHTKVLDIENDDYEYNIQIVAVFVRVLKNGLYCLGIEVPEKM